MSDKKRGKFITVEGTDGAGKTTQIQRIKSWVQEAYPNQEVIFTREPGGTPLAESIRAMIFNNEMDIFTEACLFVAARVNHIRELVMPAVERGAIVISDRYMDSSLVYQGHTHGNTPYVALMNMVATCFPSKEQMERFKGRVINVNDDFEEMGKPFLPDVTFFLKCPYEVAQARLMARAGVGEINRLDVMVEEYKRRHSELTIAHVEDLMNGPQNPFSNRDFVIIDAAQSQDEVFNEMKGHLVRYMEDSV